MWGPGPGGAPAEPIDGKLGFPCGERGAAGRAFATAGASPLRLPRGAQFEGLPGVEVEFVA